MLDRPATEVAVQARAGETREAILAAARSLFVEHGVDGTSVEKIRARAYISRGAFYHHFRSKEEVLVALATDRGPQIQARFEELMLLSTATTHDLVMATLRLFAREIAAMPRGVARSITSEMVRAWSEEGTTPPGLRANLEVLIERGRRRGELPPGWRSVDLAAVLFGSAFATVVEWLATVDASPAALDTTLRLRAAGVLAPR